MKTCDCFFDVGMFAKINQLKCKEFQKLCTCNQTMTFFFLLSCQLKNVNDFLLEFYKRLFSNYQSQKNSHKYQGLIVWNGLMKMIAFTVPNILNSKNTVLHVKLKL